MAAAATLPALLFTLTDSLTSASSSLPEPETLTPPTDGISLLDTKNELLLSYLQNLVFLIILKLRSQNPSPPHGHVDGEPPPDLTIEVTKKLVELRIYLEKGVRPLESRLKYQLDKLLLAASEATLKAATNGVTKPSHASNGPTQPTPTSSDEETTSAHPPTVSDLSYRPNPSALARPTTTITSITSNSTTQGPTGPYRPPRITPTALPTTERKQARPTKPRKSQTLDAFIREEMDDAPIAEPSIGAGSRLRGKEREREEERKGYEEQRLVRLPGEKRKGRDRRRGEDITGGLGALGDVEFGVGKERRKRERDRGDGEGERIGERWEKRVKRGVGKKRR